jgi:hypothetical protein
MKSGFFSGRFWFKSKNKQVDLQTVSPIETRELEEVFSVADYLCIPDPLAGSNKASIAIAPEVIASYIFSIFSNEESVMNEGVKKFFQEQGAEQFESSQYSYNDALGYSARVNDKKSSHTILIGYPANVARSSIPFHEEIAEATKKNSGLLCVAIDGIVYATFRIDRSLV